MTMFLSKLSWVSIAVFAAIVFASVGYTDTWTQHTQATINDIASETVATTPADRTRTTIGIGEEVICSIDPDTWADKDCNVTTQEVKDDEIGTKQWSASGAGTVVPITAGIGNDSCTLTAHQSPGTVVVTVTIKDSEQKYNDIVTKNKTFTVLAPNGQDTEHVGNLPMTGYTQNSAGTWIGTSSEFKATITASSPVNFQKARIAEEIPYVSWQWPDSTNDSFGPRNYHAGDPGYTPSVYVTPSLNASNEWPDGRSQKDGGRALLDGLTGTFMVGLTINMEYQNQSDIWVQFFNGANDGGDQGFEYTGPTDEGRAKMKGSSGDDQGNWRGPWTKP